MRTIEKAVNTKEPRLILRVLRGLASTRKRINEDVLRRLILFYYNGLPTEREHLLGFLQSVVQVSIFVFGLQQKIWNFQPMDVETEKPTASPLPGTHEKQVTSSRPTTSRIRTASLPEVDLYLHLLVLLFLIDRNSLKTVIVEHCFCFFLNRFEMVFFFKALDCARRVIDKTSVLNRRTLDFISAKCYFYYARIFELNNMLEAIRPYVIDDVLLTFHWIISFHRFLHSRLRTATLRNDFEGTAVLINLLLRNYLHYNLYSQAQKLVLRSVFPDHASNNEWARYLYYLGIDCSFSTFKIDEPIDYF